MTTAVDTFGPWMVSGTSLGSVGITDLMVIDANKHEFFTLHSSFLTCIAARIESK